jgi:nucleoid DNA-binding protein
MIGKADLANRIAKRTGISNTKANEVVGAFTEEIVNALTQGEEVRLTGFGSFKIVERGERMGRNPRTGEAITVAGGPRPTFSPGTRLMEAVKGGTRHAA